MGAMTGLLLLPVMAPVWGFGFVLEQLRDEAEAVLYDEGRGFAELIDLSRRHGAGELSDAEFAEQEAVVLERLSWIRQSREEMLNAELDPAEDEDGFIDIDVEPAVYDDDLLDAEPELCEVVR